MNPSSSSVCHNPPPPGTELSDGEDVSSNHSSKKDDPLIGFRTIDRIDPYLKNPEYIEYERKRSRHRSRSRSRGRRDRRRRSRSGHYRRSRSKSRRRRRRYSSSRSRSSSRDRHRHGKDSKHRSRHSRSRSRSRSRSKSRRHKSSKYEKSSKRHSLSRYSRSHSEEERDQIKTNDIKFKQEIAEDDGEEVDDEEEDEEYVEPVKENAFKNDGSFLEMFKKMQEQQQQQQQQQTVDTTNQTGVKKPLPAFGKRRGGKVLKTGLVQKAKTIVDEDGNAAQDAWSVYMKEVRRYKEACCDDDSKTRPLVK